MSKAITSLGGSGPREIMVDAATIIYTAGFVVIKQKGLDGEWVEVQ